ncbi:MAG: AMP-binding protein [Chloroflexi bacterium]|nr:AMP-binding protein [Chloroflexota bacterium]
MNLANLYEDGVRKFGEYDACYFEGKWFTNKELNRRADRLGNALKSLGIKKGDRVVTQLPNCIEIFVVFNAVYRMGAVIVPMNPILKPDQISYIYRDCGAKAVITSSDYLPWITAARANAPDLKHIILIDKTDVPETLYFGRLLEDGSDECRIEDMENDDLAALIYTSGTTGNPKGVMHTHYTLWINAVCFADFQFLCAPTTVSNTVRQMDEKTHSMVETQQTVTGSNRNILFLAVLPLSHSYGISFLNFGALVGGRFAVMKWWNPAEALRLIQELKIAYIAFVPTMYVHLLDHPDLANYDLSSLKFCACGAAALDPEVGLKWKERTGVHILEGWGMTESGATTSANPGYCPPKYGSIGINMLSCNRMSVFDNNDRELPAGATGELVIKGAAVMKGYWNLPEETAETLKNGWLHTGDIGYRDEDGYFYITDRKKDLIIRGGENISPKEVEDVISSHPGVAEAACIGIKDRVYGEEVKAFVVLRPGEKCSEQDIIEHCGKSLPSFKTPRQVQFIDALPKNILGKMLRAELRKQG